MWVLFIGLVVSIGNISFVLDFFFQPNPIGFLDWIKFSKYRLIELGK